MQKYLLHTVRKDRIKIKLAASADGMRPILLNFAVALSRALYYNLLVF